MRILRAETAASLYHIKKQQFRLLGPLGQGHNIVVHIRGSSAQTARFKELAGRMTPIDNRTRWNSWYEMLLVLLNLRPAVEKYYADYKEELEEDLLSFADWKKLRTISRTSLLPLHELLLLLRETLRRSRHKVAGI
jgi:hypothetical protein